MATAKRPLIATPEDIIELAKWLRAPAPKRPRHVTEIPAVRRLIVALMLNQPTQRDVERMVRRWTRDLKEQAAKSKARRARRELGI